MTTKTATINHEKQKPCHRESRNRTRPNPHPSSQKYGISRQWVHTLVTRYQLEGIKGIEPRSKKPKTLPHKTSPALRNQIIKLRKDLTREGSNAGPETIAWHLAKDGIKPPSTSTIRRILTQESLIKPEPKKRPKNSYIRFEAELPNQTWQADITHWFLTNGTRIDILDFLDDHSRYLLHIHADASISGGDVVTVMNNLINRYGPPQSTLTDNGMVFTTRLARYKGARNGFEKLLETHKIRQKNGAPGHPQTQGKIERFHQTLKKWLNARPKPETIKQAQKQLTEFTNWYNTKRPHAAVGMRTPEQAYTSLPKATPENITEPEWRTRVDKVDTNGKVTIRYAGQIRHLGIGRTHKGQRVLLTIRSNQVTTSLAATGEIIAEHRIDASRDYQAPTKTNPHPTPKKSNKKF